MNSNKLVVFATILAVLFSIMSCEKENEEDLNDDDNVTTCETEDVTFSGKVTDILEQYQCVSCHNSIAASGGVMLHDYANVKVYADNGKLLGSIKHESGFSAMPQGSGKIPSCNIEQIEAWINDGAPNN